MAPLPVFNKDPLSSALAIMAFPDDHQKAYLCSCWIIVQGMADVLIKHQPEEAAAHIASKSAEFAQFFSEWHRRQQEGVFVGTLVNSMVSPIKQDRSVARNELSGVLNRALQGWKRLRIRSFDKFDEDNDPHCEHDFGLIEDGDVRCFWKIDYYDLDMELMSPDPADPFVTTRVLTVMLAEEY
jgi:hypothetical protein